MRFLVASLLLTVGSLAGCISDGGFNGAIQVDDNYFDPDALTIEKGTTLEFSVDSSAKELHTVTIHRVADPPGVFVVDENVTAGVEVPYRFDSEGTYHVFCKWHARTMTTGMSMEVSVE